MTTVTGHARHAARGRNGGSRQQSFRSVGLMGGTAGVFLTFSLLAFAVPAATGKGGMELVQRLLVYYGYVIWAPGPFTLAITGEGWLLDLASKAVMVALATAFVAKEAHVRGMNPVTWAVASAAGLLSPVLTLLAIVSLGYAIQRHPVVMSPVRKARASLYKRLLHLSEAYSKKRAEQDATEDDQLKLKGHIEGAPIANELYRDMVIIFFFSAITLFLSAFAPPPLHEAADPAVQGGWILPDWYLLWSYGLLKAGAFLPSASIAGVEINALFWGSQLSGVYIAVLALVPFIDKGRAKRPVESPIQASLGIGYLVFSCGITVYAFNMIVLSYYGVPTSEGGDCVNEAAGTCIGITDAMLRFFMVVPPFIGTAAVYAMLKNRQARGGYEYELNKCYGCNLCEDVCPITKVEVGPNPDGVDSRNANLNLIYNIWQNRHDGVALNACLSCDACSQICPQDKEYTPYILSQRTAVEYRDPKQIPHQVMAAVLEAELEEPELAIPKEMLEGKDKVAYFPGCVDYYDMEMKFSHENSGTANHGKIADSALKLLRHVGVNPIYMDRTIFKCCGHDQLWQGRTKAFEEFRKWNVRLIKEAGIETIVATCAECVRALKIDYNLEERLGVSVQHISQFLQDKELRLKQPAEGTPETKVTFHDPCRLSRHLGETNAPRNLIHLVPNTSLIEMQRTRENSMCCGISAMMYCNDRTKAIRTERVEEAISTGAEIMLLGCPKCYTHFECLKQENRIKGAPEKHKIEFMDIAVFLADRLEDDPAAPAMTATGTVEAAAKVAGPAPAPAASAAATA